jgi:hypothetical protein
MAGFAGKAFATPAGSESVPDVRAGDLYDRYAVGLYRQALVTLDDAGTAGRVVADVLAGEFGRPQPRAGGIRAGGIRADTLEDSAGEVGRRLAVSVYWRCRHVAMSPVGAGPGGPGVEGRGALALVLYGGLDYRAASQELAIAPAEMAAILRTALHGLAATAGAPLNASET